MALWDTESLSIEASGAAESLADPTTVAGRTHVLNNNANVAQTWTSTGATPFVVNGVNAANLVISTGEARRVYSNGTRWVVIPVAVARRVFAAADTTNGAGNVTFNFVPPFPSVPVVEGQIGPSADNALVECKITALSASSVTFNVRRAPAVTLLGISVITFPVNASGATVQCIATEAGQGV